MTKTTTLHVGFDDTDSPVGMCTTYLAYEITKKLCKFTTKLSCHTEHNCDNSKHNHTKYHNKSSNTHVKFLDYPHLIRFNPNVPWKTRGNGAISMHIETNNPEYIKRVIKNLVFLHADVLHGANPGLIFLQGNTIHDDIKKFAQLALWQLISKTDAKRLADKYQLQYHYAGNAQGLVGSLGAIGYTWDDYTLELLTYRNSQMCGTPRIVNAASVCRMQKHTALNTFNNYDEKKNRILITPRGPDPVFYGIRGENAESLILASKMLQSAETPQGYMVFRTNQGTGAHLKNELVAKYRKPYSSGWISGVVSEKPFTIARCGGHVFFDVFTESSSIVSCAVYKPTKITHIARNLIKGDTVRIGGGIRKASKNHPRVLNVEYIDVIALTSDTYFTNPTCQICKKNMKSKGATQGFACVNCKRRAESKVAHQRPRMIQQKLYIPDVSAQRHLTRPEQRFSIRNCDINFDENNNDDNMQWLQVYEN